jgi:hypothetical protein
VALQRRLHDLGHDAAIAATAPPMQSPAGLSLLVSLERLLYRRRENGPGEPVAAGKYAPGNAELVIDLAGVQTDPAVACLRPLCDGIAGEAGAIAALLDGRSPRITIISRKSDEGPRQLAAGLAALEEPGHYTASFDRVCGRLGDLIMVALRHIEAGGPVFAQEPQASAAIVQSITPLRFGSRSLAARIATRLTRLARGREAWRVGWRRTAGDEIRTTLRWPDADYAVLPDDGARYYADPFVFRHEGTDYVFCEEFPYATGRAILSVFTVSGEGVASPPRPILERPYHLSYPMIFRHRDAIFMIPETSAAGGVELWRADRFPDRWVKEATIIEGTDASDATLIERGGRLWLFAAVAGSGQSSWDALHLFHADRLEGPWHPHPENPVLIDARCARPAGHMFERAGTLWRPAQDCSGGYGSGLTMCSIDQLDPDHYTQRVEQRLMPPAAWRATGAHTLNAAGNIEVIDVLAPASIRILPKPRPDA